MTSPKELEKENAKLREQVEGLKKRVAELEAQKAPSKSRQQAEEGLQMLQEGPVSKEQLAKLNPKYPSDVVYYIKNILKQPVVRYKGAYMLPQHYEILKAKEAESTPAPLTSQEALPETQASA